MKLFNETAPTERGWEGVPVSLSVRSTPLLKAFLVPFSREPDWRAHSQAKVVGGGSAQKKRFGYHRTIRYVDGRQASV